MQAETLTMSKKEQGRAEVIRQIIDGYIKQRDAARRLGISTRQVRNLAHAYRLGGGAGLIHGNVHVMDEQLHVLLIHYMYVDLKTILPT